MRPPRLRFTVRTMMVAVVIIGADLAAINWVATARSHMTWGSSRGPRERYSSYFEMYDGSTVTVIRNYETGKTISSAVTRPATRMGLCRVWWPAAAAGFFTSLALAVAVFRPHPSSNL